MSRNVTFEKLRSEYAELWAEMEYRENKIPALEAGARKILAGKDRYQDIEAQTNIPWYVVGLIHKMESNCNFSRHLHNGNSLKKRTHLVPKGRPRKGSPPFTFVESATDALQMKGYHKIGDWPIERIAWCLERYNGWGYRKYHSNVLSPYLWSYSKHYRRGKYVSDRKWSSTAVSGQAGAMPLLNVMMEMDDSIRIGKQVRPRPLEEDETPVEDESEEFQPAEERPIKKKAKKAPVSILTLIAGFFAWISDGLQWVFELLGKVVTQVSSLSPAKSLFVEAGANAGTITIAILAASAVAVLSKVFAEDDD